MNDDTTTATATLMLPCAYCGAGVQEWCVTRATETRGWSAARRLAAPITGRSTWLHAARCGPVMMAWRVGYIAGRRDQQSIVASKLSRIGYGPAVSAALAELQENVDDLTA